jgi:hypothetical protein
VDHLPWIDNDAGEKDFARRSFYIQKKLIV